VARERRPEHRGESAGYLLVPTRIWTEERMRNLTVDAQSLYLNGLREMVDLGSTDLIPQRFVDEHLPTRTRRTMATGLLVAGGLWQDAGLGWQVIDWLGIQVHLGLTRAHISKTVRAAVYARDGHRCLDCGATDRLSLDHIIPWSAGGSDKPDNLRTLCIPCNSHKGARRLPQEGDL
jgi:hypothetical protein